MADLSDVTDTLKTLIAGILYPVAPTAPNEKSPVAGVPVRIQVGWPTPEALKSDKACERSCVSLYPLPGERNTTRYPKTWNILGSKYRPVISITFQNHSLVIRQTGTNSGFVQNVAAQINGTAYIHSAKSTESPEQIAGALGAQIAADVLGTTILGATVQLPDTTRVGFLRVGTGAPTGQELRRQNRTIQIMILSPRPQDRDIIAKAIDPVLADTPRFDLPDGFGARLLYQSSPFSDFDQKFGLFRRDFLYQVEYPTTVADIAPEVATIKSAIEKLV